MPDFVVALDIEETRLVRRLPDHEPVGQLVFAFYAEHRHIPQKI
ncbi:hypothetical protein OCK02_24210 [Rhizobium sp. TRM96647]|nr:MULTISPECIES: hypothetical protein [unclassified Rhizobium]MCV3739279.1 hypothetical protein [Rhizobium sp. TRM96647]MCV3760971.1 hypothetical protein [Rhizobium sp. TRM96650]